MPVNKRTQNPAQFAELLEVFPCPAWIENLSGQILARNAHPCPIQGQRLVKSAHPLPPVGNTKELRLVAFFPAEQEADCQRRIISALLAKAHQARKVVAVDESLLTSRQREIYRNLSCGYSYKEIAKCLGISHDNVLVQTTRMRKTLGLKFLPLRRRKKPAADVC